MVFTNGQHAPICLEGAISRDIEADIITDDNPAGSISSC
jgi:hypothetical protein